MSDFPSNPVYQIWAGIYYILRSRVFWGVVAVAMIIWFLRDRGTAAENEFQEQFYEEAMEAELDQLIAESKTQSLISEAGGSSKGGKSPEVSFFFSPMLCEAIATRSHQKLGRMPTNWADIVSSGVTEKIPPPRKGHKYVYDPKTGTIEEEPESDDPN